MKVTKLLVPGLAFACVAMVSAQYTSPELMLVTDLGGTTANGNVTPPQIERYDPISGQYLGAFGAGYVTEPYGITVVGQQVYVTDLFHVGSIPYSRIVKFNFSTGAYQGTIFSSTPDSLTGVAKYGTSTLACDFGTGTAGDAVYTFDSTGNVSGTQNLTAGSQAYGMAVDDTHDYVATLTHGLFSYNLNAQGVSTGLNFNLTANSWQGVATLQTATGYHVFVAGANGASTLALLSEYSPSGVLQSTYSVAPSTAYFYSLAFGHNGLLYALSGVGGARAYRFDSTQDLSYGPLGSFALRDSGDAADAAVYAAPEPFTVVGLGLGVLALLRRRRASGER